MIRKALLAALFLAVGSVAALASDFNGKWTADFTTPKGAQTVSFDFHVDGAALTGKFTSNHGNGDVQEGKIDGVNISFTHMLTVEGTTLKVVYKGKIKGDELDLNRQAADRPAIDIVAKRVK